ncbi:MAG: hypothetical protein LRY55_02395 [Leadbetterella sp.]|nr:hypothetical protein [Leadbetterella sp.]
MNGKEVLFDFKNGVEEKLERVLINQEEVAWDARKSSDTYRITGLKPRKNRITLIFKDGEKFSTPLLGGRWNKIIVSEWKSWKRYRQVSLGIALGCIVVSILGFLVTKNEAIRGPLMSMATANLLFNYIFTKNQYSVLFR